MFLNEDHFGDPNDESSMARNQLKNIMKNSQAMLDIISGGQQLDAWIQSNLAVVDSKLQDAKNYMENEAEENHSEVDDQEQLVSPISMDEPGMNSMGQPDNIPAVDSHADMLPPPFPDEETDDEGMDSEFDIDIDGDGIGDVNVLDVETRYEDELEDDEDEFDLGDDEDDR